MSEKQVIVTLEDGFGRVQTSISTNLSAPQLMDKIMEIDEHSCENCKNFSLFDEEAINIDKTLNAYGDCIYHGEVFNKKSLCKHWEFVKED